jgi:hypothetical protein
MASVCLRTLIRKDNEQQGNYENACFLGGDSEGEEEVFVSPDFSAWISSSPGTRASPPVLMDVGDDDPDDPPAVQEEIPPP